MKNLLKILLLLLISLSFISSISYTYSAENRKVEINTLGGDEGRNDDLSSFGGPNLEGETLFFDTSIGGVKGAKNTLVKIARDLKNLFFALATLYLMIIVIKILFTSNTEEDVEKFKKGIIWTTIGILIMQSAYAFVDTIYNEKIDQRLAYSFIEKIVDPLIGLMEVFASIFFLAIAIFSFYKLATSNGDEEKAKSGKMSIVYAIIGFILIKLSRGITQAVYGKLDTSCEPGNILGSLDQTCLEKAEINDLTKIILDVLSWVNGFIGILVVIMIIYTGSQVLLSAGDEEKLKKAKTSLIYIAIGLGILAMNYLIVTFFILPETTI